MERIYSLHQVGWKVISLWMIIKIPHGNMPNDAICKMFSWFFVQKTFLIVTASNRWVKFATARQAEGSYRVNGCVPSLLD